MTHQEKKTRKKLTKNKTTKRICLSKVLASKQSLGSGIVLVPGATAMTPMIAVASWPILIFMFDALEVTLFFGVSSVSCNLQLRGTEQLQTRQSSSLLSAQVASL